MLVKKLDPDNLNIGRPSTYAAIISKIQEKEYVKKTDNEGIQVESKIFVCNQKEITEKCNKIVLGKDFNKLCPTNMGKTVTKFLIESFPEIMDYKFTANMEEELDKVAEGKKKINSVLSNFYGDFHKVVENLNKKEIKIMDSSKRILGKDPESGLNIIATVRKYGPIVMIEVDKGKPNMAPIKLPLTLESITLTEAIELLSYPKLLGRYERKEVKLHRGKFGLYVKYGNENITLNNLKTDKKQIDKINEINEINEIELEEIKLDDVIELIKDKMKKYLWTGKDGKVEYLVMEGPYGKFINVTDKSKKISKPLNVKFPDDEKIETMTIDRIKKLVEEGKINKFKNKFNKKN